VGKHAATMQLLEIAQEVLREAYPQTVRQVFYQLVSRQVLENSEKAYKRVSHLLSEGRQDGEVAWERIEDRNRRPRPVAMWDDPADFAQQVTPQYRRDVWQLQPAYLECWLEKDALSGIVEDVIRPYGVTLCVGKGYDGWSSIHWAAERYTRREARGQPVTVLYLGDFDPSGEDMVRSLRERLSALGACPTIRKVALTREQLETYRLPPNRTKSTDSRRAAFVAQHGDETAELDALPVAVLRTLLRTEIEAGMDLNALDELRRQEHDEREDLAALFARGA